VDIVDGQRVGLVLGLGGGLGGHGSLLCSVVLVFCRSISPCRWVAVLARMSSAETLRLSSSLYRLQSHIDLILRGSHRKK
jgi:hypothetical protein